MTKKIARRWLRKNDWNIAKFNLGFFKEGSTQFSKQYFTCRRNSILFRKFT